MKHYKLNNKYFQNINKLLININDKLVNNRFDSKISLEFIDEKHKDFDIMVHKILNCENNFYNYKEDFINSNIHIVSIKSFEDIIGFITFEDIDDFANYENKVLNLVAFYIDKDYRKKQIATKILFAFVLFNYDQSICMVISEPNIEMGGVIRNSAYNLLTMVNTGMITFNGSINKFIDYLSAFGLMVKVNYFGMKRFQTCNIKLVSNHQEYKKYQFERAFSNEESINIGVNSYIYGFEKCIKENQKPFATNILYYVSRKEKKDL